MVTIRVVAVLAAQPASVTMTPPSAAKAAIERDTKRFLQQPHLANQGSLPNTGPDERHVSVGEGS